MKRYSVLAIRCQWCDNLENIEVFGNWNSEDNLDPHCNKCEEGPRVCIGLVGEYIK